MEKIRIRKIYALFALGAFLWLLPSVGLGACDVFIGPTQYPSITAALNAAGPFTTINVSGICNEAVTISADKSEVTLNGGGTATLICPGSPCTTQNIRVFGKQISIRGFNITGGLDGIGVVGGGATIYSNTIYNTQRSGIAVVETSLAIILNNTIQDAGVNPNFPLRSGIGVYDNSSAYIGILSPVDASARPNVIQNNPNGIVVSRSSSARIIGNTISNNTDDGIKVVKASLADISDNIIDGNGQNGIFVSQGSGVNLGNDTGNTILDLPNSGRNGDKGLRCSIGGYADGRLGTLNGAGKHNATEFSKDCIDSLIP